MRTILGIILIFSIVAFLGLFNILLLRYLNKNWWQIKWIRWATYFPLLVGILSLTLLTIGFRFGVFWLVAIGTVIAVPALILLLALMLALPFSGIVNLTYLWLEKRAARHSLKDREFKSNRRAFLKGAAAVFPIMTVSAGGGGIIKSFQRAKVYMLPLEFTNLPPRLEGLKILHLTDSHLGTYKFLGDLEEVILQAQEHKPDITLFTGDIADDLALLPDALKMAASLNPKYGTYASLGNHEYYRGINEVLRILDKSTVRLMQSSGSKITIGDASLYLAGADDPRLMRQDNSAFLRKTIEDSLDGAPSDAFYLLMSHRPEAFDAAVEFGVDLTLSGHTHGGQIGINGHSFWETFMPDRYLWGKYEKAGSLMYLSSGIGHWFPFRLGCPPEAPIIELVSKQ